MTRPFVLAIALAAYVALPATAWAKPPRVALTPFDGDPGGEVQDAVTELLDGDLSIVKPSKVSRTVDKLGLEGELSDKDLKKLSSELDADAIVQTKLSTKGGNKVLHFKLFIHGKKAKGFKIEFASLKSSKFKQALHDKMVEKIGDAKGGDDDDDKPVKKKKGDDDDKPVKKKKGEDDAAKKKKGSDDDDDKPVKKKKGSDDDDATVAKKKKGGDDDEAKKNKGDDDDAVAKKGDDDDKPVKKKGDDADEDKPKKKKIAKGDDDAGEVESNPDDTSIHLKASGRAANHVAIRVDGGLSVMTRRLTFAATGPNAPTGYKNSPVPGARIEGEMYPLVFSSSKSPAAGLGIGGFFDQTLSLSLQSTEQPGTKFPVTERNWSIGLRYRIPFGGSDVSPTLTIGVGYGNRVFKTNTSALMPGNVIDLPNVDYVGFDPGVVLRVPLASMFALVLGGNALLLTGAGDIVSLGEYGQAKVTGIEAMGGFDIVVTSKIAIKLTGEYTRLGFVFTGNGLMANDGAGNQTVGGAADTYVGGAATLAVLY